MVLPEVCHPSHPSQVFLAGELPFAEGHHHIFRSTEGFPEIHEKAHLDFSSAGLSAQRQTQMHMSCHFPAYRGKSHQTIAHRLKAVLPHLYFQYSGRRFPTLVAALSCLQEQSQTTQPSSRKIKTKDARSSTRLFNAVATIGGRCL